MAGLPKAAGLFVSMKLKRYKIIRLYVLKMLRKIVDSIVIRLHLWQLSLHGWQVRRSLTWLGEVMWGFTDKGKPIARWGRKVAGLWV